MDVRALADRSLSSDVQGAAHSHALEADTHPLRWRMLALLATAELLGMSLWLTGSAVAPLLTARWQLDASQGGMLTTLVQLGFVVGTAMAALLNIADVVPARVLFATCALLGAVANAALAWSARYDVALATRFATGVFLAGVYPPAMKMAATWFRARRGLAIGTVVGALTVGKAGPYLVQAFNPSSVVPVVAASSASAVAAAVLVWVGYRDGPYVFPARPFHWGLVTEVVRERRWRLATGGYLGHMAELYSFWTWIPAFVAASMLAHAGTSSEAAEVSRTSSALAFTIVAAGGIGCVWGGLVADRWGRPRLVTMAMAASGTCALLVALAFGRSLWVVAPIALAWGFFVIADSAQFSALVTESVAPHAVGTALTLQTSVGFLLTTVTIQLVPLVVRDAGWRWAFALLAIGPALGIMSIRRLVRG